MTVPEVVKENFGLMDSQQPNPPVTSPREIPHPMTRMVTHLYHLTKGEADSHP